MNDLQLKDRASSFTLEGTGKYKDVNEALKSCIANEKGLLMKEDFEHVSTVIEVYSKALLCEMRENHQKDRAEVFQKKDWVAYRKMVLDQIKREVKIFNRATIEILTTANIKTSVFNQSVELYLEKTE